MADVFGFFKESWIVKKKPARINDGVFLLHTRVTQFVLLMCAAAVSLKQFFGDPIHCNIGKADISQKVMDHYCWLKIGSYIMTSPNGKPYAEKKGAHPGIFTPSEITDEQRKYQGYYQWIWLLLFLQAVLFSVPERIWKRKENGMMTEVVKDIHESIYMDQDVKEKKQCLFVKHYVESLKGKIYDPYARWFLFCEVFNLFNVISQFIFMDMLLDNHFFSYGIRLFGGSGTQEMNRIFPKVTKCQFPQYGPSGSIVPYDSICVLAINVVNERIFLFLWLWFVMLLSISVGKLFYRALTCLNIGNIRYISLLRMQRYIIDPHVVYKLNKILKFGDWFMLNLLSANVDPLMFRDLMELTARHLKGEDITFKSKTTEEKKSSDDKMKAIKDV